MTLWERISKTLDEGYTATREGISTLLEKTGELTQIARLRIRIIGVHRKIHDNFFELGGRIYDLVSRKKKGVLTDPEVSRLLDEVKALEKEIKNTEEEIEKIKMSKEKEEEGQG